MVTIKDVAKKAGVSIATVSRVLNNSDHPLDPITRQKVLDAIEELGYIPNAAARSLQLKRTKTIGILLPSIANAYYSSIVDGAEEVAYKYGYGLILCITNRSWERTKEHIQLLSEKRVDGVIFTGGGALDDAKRNRVFQDSKLSMIVIGRHNSDLPAVQVDNVKVGFQATEHLISLGHKRIATITGPKVSTTAEDRYAGYKMALESYGLEEDISIVAEGDFLVQSGYVAASGLPLQGKSRVTAVFAQNDLMAIGAIRFLKSRGLKIPEDVSVVGCDDLELAFYITPPLTTVAVPAYELGKTAMEVMVDSLNGNKVPSLKILPTELKVRESTIKIN